MKIHRLVCQQRVEAPLGEVFEFFSRAHNLERITPPWLRFELLTREPVEMRIGALIDYRLHVHGLPLRWRSRIECWEPGRAFVDRSFAVRTACGTTATSSRRPAGRRLCAMWCTTRSRSGCSAVPRTRSCVVI